MYFIFPDNLPVSVQKAAFEFTSGQFPLYRYITPDTEILNRGISIAIPDEASHIRSIRLTTSLSHFTYYYPEKGYKIAQGIHLPPFRVPAVGDLYANGVIIQAGADSPGQHIEPDIAPYKGSVMEIREQTLDYFDALIYCESISEGTLDNWHLPLYAPKRKSGRFGPYWIIKRLKFLSRLFAQTIFSISGSPVSGNINTKDCISLQSGNKV